jgi:hypothetical protein
MRFVLPALLCLMSANALPPLLLAGDPGGRVHYIGGTIAALPSKTEGAIQLTDEEALLFRCREATIRIPYSQVIVLEYGQRVSRRYAAALISPMLLLSKKRGHFLTIHFSDDHGRQQALIFEVSKGNIRTMLVSLEARTGRKVDYQDEEARRAGKG